MSTTTATIFIGHSHQNSGGINPTHLIQFTENSRPALILTNLEEHDQKIVLIPTLENTIDDIYLMIGVFILKKISPSQRIDNIEGKCLYEILDEAERLELYTETLSLFNSISIKVVFNILENSHLLRHIDQIKRYPNDFEVTTPFLKKEYNTWSDKIETKGI